MKQLVVTFEYTELSNQQVVLKSFWEGDDYPNDLLDNIKEGLINEFIRIVTKGDTDPYGWLEYSRRNANVGI